MIEFDFFDKLDKENQEFLIKNSNEISIAKDTILFYQGDICKDILLLESGKVKLSIYGELNEEITLYEITQGEQCIINTSSTLSQTPAIASAQTLTDIKGRLVPSNIIKELILKSPDYQSYIFSNFALKFNALTTLIEDIKFKRLDTRILEFLRKFDNSIVEITHEELATNLSTSRVVISRLLKDLERKNLIKLHRKKIEIL